MYYDHDCGTRFLFVKDELNPTDSGVYCRACKKKFVFKKDDLFYSYDLKISKLIESKYDIKINILN